MSQAVIDTWRHPIREIARRVAKKVRDRSIEASDLEQIGLLAVLQLDGIESMSDGLVRTIVRCRMWDAVPHYRSKYLTVEGGYEVAERTPSWPPSMADVIDARRLAPKLTGRAALVAEMTLDGCTSVEIGEALGISRQAANETLRRAWRAYEDGRPIGVRGRPRRAA